MRTHERFTALLLIATAAACAADDGTVGAGPEGAIDPGVADQVHTEFEDQAAIALPSAEQSDALHRAGRVVGELAATSTDLLTGVALDGRANALVVAYPAGADDVRQEATLLRAIRLAGVGDEIAIRFAPVGLSRADLDVVRADLGERFGRGDFAAEEVTGIGEDPSRGVVIVYSAPRADAARVLLRQEYGDAVVFRPGTAGRFTSRLLDPAPQIGGAGYGVRNLADTQMMSPYCSTAFPVDYNGAHYMLTAGHCFQYSETNFINAWAEQYTSGHGNLTYYFGKRSVTTFGHTQNTYGDFAMLKGSTYQASVYDTNTTSVAVAEVDWGTPSINEQVCRSGRTTGKVCRLFITDSDYQTGFAIPNGGATLYQVVKMAQYRSDQNLDGVNDCNVGEGGDSGGAVFQWVGSKFRAMGIMTGVIYGNTCKDYRGAYTRLSGPKAAYPSMTMPVRP